MALIKCMECGKEVSDKATACPNCGCPLAEMITKGIVKIKMPRTEQIADGFVGLLSSKNVTVKTSRGWNLWSGQHGQTATFEIDEPMDIVIDLGKWGNQVSGRIKPKTKYELVQDLGIHLKATFRLSEVDVIDSGL